ncbi:MAG TPA: sigma-70 family RNA polymerase sigma factor [Gemmatimonadales bacterium]|nr:sigma-70 family RNA polymerase sigma factor [Gemmatimonadales bacterium]
MTAGGGSDAEVIARILSGDVEAFGALITRYEGGLLRFATRMLGSRDAAADAVAEGLVRAYRHLASCRDPARFRTWVFRIVANRCKSHLARRPAGDVSLDDAPPLAGPENAEAAFERTDQLERLERALATLTPEKREAFVLKHLDGMSYEEMSAVTGERVPTLKMRVHRAREALLAALKESP